MGNLIVYGQLSAEEIGYEEDNFEFVCSFFLFNVEKSYSYYAFGYDHCGDVLDNSNKYYFKIYI